VPPTRTLNYLALAVPLALDESGLPAPCQPKSLLLRCSRLRGRTAHNNVPPRKPGVAGAPASDANSVHGGGYNTHCSIVDADGELAALALKLAEATEAWPLAPATFVSTAEAVNVAGMR
jgi:hypothetical protein